MRTQHDLGMSTLSHRIDKLDLHRPHTNGMNRLQHTHAHTRNRSGHEETVLVHMQKGDALLVVS